MFNLDSSLGIAIQGGSLILATVRKGMQEYSVKNHLAIEEFRELSPADLRERIQHFVKSNGFNRDNIMVALPREQVVVRQVELPIEVEENLQQVLRSQVERFEPSEEERSYFDYTILNRDEEAARILIQIVMARQNLVDEYLALLRDLDLYPAVVGYTSVGLQSLFLAHQAGFPKAAAAVVIQLDPAASQMIVVTGKRQLFSRPLRLVEEKLSVESLLEELDHFVSRLELRFDEFSRIYLLGEWSGRLVDEFRKEIGDCEPLVEHLRLGRKGVTDLALNGILSAVGIAISGLAKAGPARVNLIPLEKRFAGGKPNLITTYVLAASLLVLLLGLGTRDYFQQRMLVNRVDAQVQRLQGRVEEVLRLREQVAAERAELNELKGVLSGRQEVLLVMKDLSERIPDDTYLQQLQMQGEQITVTGYSDQAASLVPVLLQSPYLESVKTNWINKDQRMQKERFNFAATIRQQP